jgi:hypothetical protein
MMNDNGLVKEREVAPSRPPRTSLLLDHTFAESNEPRTGGEELNRSSPSPPFKTCRVAERFEVHKQGAGRSGGGYSTHERTLNLRTT